MNRVFLAKELEGVATFWRILRRDGVALGFTAHDRDLWFDGVLHRAAPGMVPSAIRRSKDLDDDSAEVEGVLAHDSIDADDLAQGRFDGARVMIGVIDWENGENAVLYRGSLGAVNASAGHFTADLRPAKAVLDIDPVARTSPLCRARFCGPGCTLSAARFTVTAALEAVAGDGERIRFAGIDQGLYRYGELVWLDGPGAGTRARIVDAGAEGLLLDRPFEQAPRPGDRARLRQGCDHTFATCSSRFGNAVNFQGEPFLPGNDLIARYPRAP